MKSNGLNKFIICLGGAAVVLGLFSAPVFALSITPTSGMLNITRWESNDNSNCNAACVSTLTGMPNLVEVYKQDQGDEPTDTGALAGSYSTTFANLVSDPQDATITYGVGNSLDCPNLACKLVVKDGKNTPAIYAFDLNALGWNGTETLNMTGFWPNQGAISHVALYSGSGEPIPEPSTMLLFGTGLAGLVAWRYRKQKTS